MANEVGQGKGQEEIAAEKCHQAFELIKKGWTLREIGKAVGVSHVTALKYVKKVLKELSEETKELGREYIEIELKRLDTLLKAFEDKASQGDVAASDMVLKIMARRSKFLGLDAPIQTEINGTLKLEDLVAGASKKSE